MASTLPSSARKPRKKPPSSLTVPSIHLDVSFNTTDGEHEIMDTGTKSKKDRTQIPVKINKPSTIYRNSKGSSRPNRLGSTSSTTSNTPSVQSLENSKSREPLENNHSLEGVLQAVPGTPSLSRMSAGSDGRFKSTRGTTPKTPRKSPKPFEQYLPLEEVQRGLKKGELIEGVLRINPKNYEDAYISAPDGQMDIYIGGLLDRNRAFNGDVVAVKLHPQNKWKVLLDNIKDYEAKHSVSPSPSPSRKPSESGEAEKKVVSPPSVSQDVELDASGKKKKKKRGKKKKQSVEEVVGDEEDGDRHPLPRGGEIQDICGFTLEQDDIGKSNTAKYQFRCKPRNRNKGKQAARDPCDEVLLATMTALRLSATDVQLNVDFNPKEDYKQVASITKNKSFSREVDGNEVKMATQEMKRSIASTKTFVPMINDLENPVTDEVIAPTEENLVPPSPQLGSCSDTRITPDSGAKKQMKKAIHELSIESILQHPCGRKFVQKSGKVVNVLEPKHPRITTGQLKQMQDKSTSAALFVPSDHRVPRLKIPIDDCPSGFAMAPDTFKNVIFCAQITDWKNTGLAEGKVLRCIGAIGNIVAETEAILAENAIDTEPFPDDVLNEYNKGLFIIPEDEIAKRLDLRDECTFTIDPETAKDLDDAVSCTKLGNGMYHVGVHIADVSFFVEEKTPTDSIAQNRTTTVYLVNKAITMLPPQLCENLCSLRPGHDRLCMSVMWYIDEDGGIIDEWFGRTVIHSCGQLSYSHAQAMIDEPNRKWKPEELPDMYGKYAIEDISDKIVQLHELAQKLKQKRIDNGALRLDQLKMQFKFDKPDACPSGFDIYTQRDSNSLIEEFMLLANMAVAHKLYKSYPRNAILRCHPPPNELMMQEVVEMTASVGIHLDTSSSKSIQEKLVELGSRYIGETNQSLVPVLAHFLAKPMQRAKYFCTSDEEDPTNYHHYALSIPLYTHFTSPIRRYPDIMVHRLLGAALGLNPDPEIVPAKIVKKLMDKCNAKKWAAKIVSELSQDLYLALYLKVNGPMVSEAVVVGILDQAFDVLIMNTGGVKRIYCKYLPLASFKLHNDGGLKQLHLHWEADDKQAARTQMIMLFANVEIKLLPDSNQQLKYTAELNRPK